jgi:hypothetical protein
MSQSACPLKGSRSSRRIFLYVRRSRSQLGRAGLRFVFSRRSSLAEGSGQVLRFHRFSISRANSPAAGARQVRAYDFILALLIFGSLAGSWFYRIPLGPCVFASGARLVATGLFAAADPHTFSCCTDLAVGCYSSCSLVAAGPSSHQLSLLLSIFVAS